MHAPLSPEEKELFLSTVNHAGHSFFLDQLELAQESNQGFYISLNLYLANTEKDPLTKSIVETITAQEQLNGYKPNNIKKHKDSLAYTYDANNYLGNYTRYWHRIDDQGPYIKCISTFTNLAALHQALAEIKK
jgi:hypothetical protein